MAKIQVKELEADDYNFFENFKTAFYRLWKQKVVVALVTLLAASVALIYVGKVGIKTRYYSTATIYSVVYGSQSESFSGVTLMNTYSDLISTSRVCDRASTKLSSYGYDSATLQTLSKSGYIYLSGASTKSNSYGYKLNLNVVSPSTNIIPIEHITIIANAMANAFVSEINDIAGSASLQVMDEAKSIGRSQSMGTKMYMLIFSAVGFVGACGVIFVIEFFSSKVYCVGQCEEDKNLILGILPYNDK